MKLVPVIERIARCESNNRTALAASLCWIVLLATLFYFPALFLQRTLVHGDITTIDLPFFEFFARVMKGQASPLWSREMWGGHPLFAEGQGGFAHPLNIVWATVVTPLLGPIRSMNVFYWLLKILGGIGVMGLSRTLGASIWASTFAALALVFSPIWANEEYSIPLFHTVTWVPWALWAMEAWVKRPNLLTASLFGAAFALLLLSGYPQGAHGTAIYGFVTLLVLPLQPRLRDEWAKSLGKRAGWLLLACAVAVGLAAVQLAPLLELIGLSSRGEGVGIPFAGMVPLSGYLRGFLTADFALGPGSYPGIGSLLVCVLASLLLLVPSPDRAKAHLVAALVLLVLGTERATPIFRFLYDHHVVPGLSYFRHMDIYLAIGSIGVAVGAASAIDRLADWPFGYGRAPNMPAPATPPVDHMIAKYARWAVLAAFWFWALASARYTTPFGVEIVVTLAAGAAVFLLIAKRRQYLTAPVLTFALSIEIFSLCLHPFDFFPSSALAQPPAIAAVKSVPNWRDYQMMAVGFAGLTAFLPMRQPQYIFGIRKATAALSPLTNMRWNLPSMSGALALPLKRRTAIEDRLRAEVFGSVPTPAGLRLIDLLGIRYVTNGNELTTAGFHPLYLDRRDEIKTADNDMQVIEENDAALSLFQVYSRYQVVASLQEALNAVTNLQTLSLVIEDPDRRIAPSSSPPGSDGDNPKLDVLEATDNSYRVRISLANPAWLFLADANYPGWTASLDGKDAPIFSAQVLGKAVAIPAGDHEVIIRFRSKTFLFGLLISIATLATLALTTAVQIYRRRTMRPTAGERAL
jgi:hypothetical protein